MVPLADVYVHMPGASAEEVEKHVITSYSIHYTKLYDEGLTNMADLLSAQTALEKARFDALRADNQLLLALGNILFQQGTFVQSFLPSEESHP